MFVGAKSSFAVKSSVLVLCRSQQGKLEEPHACQGWKEPTPAVAGSSGVEAVAIDSHKVAVLMSSHLLTQKRTTKSTHALI